MSRAFPPSPGRVARGAGIALALLLAAFAAPPASATDSAADASFADACVDVHLRSGTAAAEQRCVGILAVSCMNGEGGRATEGQAACLRREAAAWVRVMDAAWEDLRARAVDAPAAGLAALDRAQAAWEAFADAECTYAHAIWGDDVYGKVAGADCRMNSIARRAIQLRAQTVPAG